MLVSGHAEVSPVIAKTKTLRTSREPPVTQHSTSPRRRVRRRRRLVVITPILAPYRVPVFNVLADRLGDEFHVIFLFETEPRRQWRPSRADIRFSYEILGGLTVVFGGPDPQPIYLSRPSLGAILRARPDHLVVGGWDHPEFLWSLIGSRLGGSTLTLWCETFRSGRDSPLARLVKRAFVGSCDSFLVPGVAAERFLEGLGAPADRIFEAPNAVDTGFFASGLAQPREHLLVVSRLHAVKGLDVALRAVSGVANAPPLVIAGHGPEEESLRRLAHELEVDVRFLGHVDAEQLRALYAGAQALLFPTLHDPWGLVVNEALAAGTPVIVSDAAGCAPSLVCPGMNGEVVPAGDPAALGAAIERVLDPTREKLLRQGASESGARHTPERCAEGFLQLIGIDAGEPIGEGHAT